jgi:ABC-type nitrate/sulfonate/bicarbonate transport system permease component
MVSDSVPATSPEAPPAARGPRGRTGRSPNAASSHLVVVARRLGVAATVIVLWEASVRWWLPSYLPSPAGVLAAMVPTLTSSDFLGALQQTLGAVVLSLVLGCVAGTGLGLAIGRIRWLRQLTAPYVSGLYAMPILAILPMVTIWLGYTSASRVAVVSLSALLPCLVSTADGARLIPRELLELTSVLKLSKRRFVVDVLVPSTLPFIIAGVQVAVGRALVGAVAVEFLASLDGLGTFILNNAHSFQQNTAFVGVLVLAAFGVLARVGTQTALHRLAPWHLHVNR